jgi:hypothetical protein
VKADLCVQRYLTCGVLAASDRQYPAAAPTFAIPGFATATAWVNSHLVMATKPRPLGLIGGST